MSAPNGKPTYAELNAQIQKRAEMGKPVDRVIQVTKADILPPGKVSPFGYKPQDPRKADQPKQLDAKDAAGGGPLRPISPANPLPDLGTQLQADVDVPLQIARLRGTMFASMLAQAEPPVSAVGAFFIGSQFASKSPGYVKVFTNQRPYPLVCIVTFEPGTNTGVAIDISYSTDQSTKDNIWTLSSGGLVKSGGILLSQTQDLWIRQNASSLTLTNEVIRVLLFDPVQFFGPSILP